jgi:hypothetical protein
MAIGIGVGVAAALWVLSLHGWWFFLTVGDSHGSGSAIGPFTGLIVLISTVTGVSLKCLERNRYRDVVARLDRQDGPR